MNIQLVDAASLHENPRNTQIHPPEQIKLLEATIKNAGMWRPIVVVGREVRMGHGTLRAAKNIIKTGKPIYPAPGKKAGAKPYPDGKIPVVDATGWSEAEIIAYSIEDNRSQQLGLPDIKMLSLELEELRIEHKDFDFAATGFSLEEIEDICSKIAADHDNPIQYDDPPEKVDRIPLPPSEGRPDKEVIEMHEELDKEKTPRADIEPESAGAIKVPVVCNMSKADYKAFTDFKREAGIKDNGEALAALLKQGQGG